jgi:hypothetical protein
MLPNRSRNYSFDLGAGRSMMVVWNDLATSDHPVLEMLYLGNDPEIIDVWGRTILPEHLGTEQIIPVTQTPIFVTGLNTDVVRFRLNMQTLTDRISAIPNQTHTIPFSYRNDSTVPIMVQIVPQGPRQGDWAITPPTQPVNLEPGLDERGEFALTLLQRADTGRRPFHYNVHLVGIDAPEFAVYDEIMIGDPDVYLEFVSRLTERGDIEVIQTFINNTDHVYTYDFQLIVRDRSVQTTQIRQQGFGRRERLYTIPRGQALLDSGITEMTLFGTPRTDGGGLLGQPMVYTIPLITE